MARVDAENRGPSLENGRNSRPVIGVHCDSSSPTLAKNIFSKLVPYFQFAYGIIYIMNILNINIIIY